MLKSRPQARRCFQRLPDPRTLDIDGRPRFAKVNDPHTLAIAVSSYARNLNAADVLIQPGLRQRWHAAGLDGFISLDKGYRPDFYAHVP